MTARHIPEILVAREEIVAPPAPRACEDRTFELPTGIYVAMAACFLGFVGVLSFALRTPELAVPFAVFVSFIAAFFVVPGLWARMAPDKNGSRALGWSEFAEDGIRTATGVCRGREATVLVMLLPGLIFGWALIIAMIVALV